MVKTLELGRRGSSHVANLLDSSRLDGDQGTQTAEIVSKANCEGLEFVRTWDRTKVSFISVISFFISLVSATVWIGVSIGRFNVEAQLAVQTAFTMASYIVTAGKQ